MKEVSNGPVQVIWNYTVPVNDKGKIILCHDRILPMVELAWEEAGVSMLADPGSAAAVRFWTIHLIPGEGDKWSRDDTHNWEFRVFGTGHEFNAGWVYIGTAPRTPLGLIWHLFRRRA